MNGIQMYSSSSDLKAGLHRVLATSAALRAPLGPNVPVRWWTELDEPKQALAREHRLGLEALQDVWLAQLEGVNETRAQLGLSARDRQIVQSAFRAAIISGRAHRAHRGRDIYGASNKALFDLLCADFATAVAERFGRALGEPFAGSVEGEFPPPSSQAMAHIEHLMSFDTTPDGEGHPACVRWLTARLEEMGFGVRLLEVDSGRPVLWAHRPARGFEGHVALYGHYDVTPFGKPEKWPYPPQELTVAEGRLHGRGIADNKGPLGARLAAIASMEQTPALTWLIQGEEETGSPVGHRVLPRVMPEIHPTVWVDETGYHDHEDGTLRILSRVLDEKDESLAPDPELEALGRGLTGLASRWGVGARPEHRGLNKNVVAGGCPFNANLPRGARYLAIGVNDSRARIHGVGESIPMWTLPHHAAQLEVVFAWTHQIGGAA